MKKSQQGCLQANRLRHSLFRLAPVAAGCAALLMTTNYGYAQEAPGATDLNRVTVTGIRKGIEDAISVKKGSDSIVESVSAEDIGKLPDVSIAESIARLPGLAAQRVAGRAQVISVRGLSPDFTATTLNGRELVSTGDNRSVEFDQYPSELMSGATVYKTPDASLVGQGLAATIDMQTVRPLNFAKRTVSLNVRREENSLGPIASGKATGDRESFTYIDQFANRTVGVALGYARMASPILDIESDLYEWNANDRSSIGVPAGAASTHGVKAAARGGKNLREGLMGVLEFRPDKNWTSTLDVFYSKFRQENTEYRLEIPMDAQAQLSHTTAGNYLAFTQNANSVQTGGTFSGAFPQVRGMYNLQDDNIKALGWSNKFKLAGVSMFADLSYSKASRDEVSLETNTSLRNSGGGNLADNVKVFWGGSGAPTISTGRNYSDISQLVLGNTEYSDGYGKLPHVEDELKGMKLVATLPVPSAMEGIFSDANVGLNFSTRAKSYSRAQDSLVLMPGVTPTISNDLAYDSAGLGFSGSGSIPTWNVPGVLAKYMAFNPTTDSDLWKAGNVYKIDEKIFTSFVKANIDMNLGGVSLRGNVGVQLQNTDQASTSREANNQSGTLVPFTDGKTYTDVLPSLNLTFGLSGDQLVRVGTSQQLARPRVDQLRAAHDFSVDASTGLPSGGGGNPRLDPWRANAYDVSYEKYFGNNAGYVSVAAFYKDLKSYVYQSTETHHDFTQDLQHYIVAPPTSPAPGSQFGNYTAPFNGQGGSVKGIEMAVSVPLKMFASQLDGFGVIAGVSMNDSAITVKDETGQISGDMPLPGLSKRVSSLTFYYEKNGFSARMSQRQRSDFVGEIQTYDGNRALKYVVGEDITDFQMGYNFDSGNFKGLGLLLQINNLTDAAYRTYSSTPDKPLDYIKYGRTLMVGATYKF